MFSGSGGGGAHQAGANSVGNLYNNPIMVEVPYATQQQARQLGHSTADGFGGIVSRQQMEEPPIVPNHHQQVSSRRGKIATGEIRELFFASFIPQKPRQQ